MAEIKMDLDEIVAIAVDIESIKKSLENDFEVITKAVDGVKDIYKSSAIDEWMKKYEKTKSSQKEIVKAIKNCSDYFENVNQVMERVEAVIEAKAAIELTNVSEWK